MIMQQSQASQKNTWLQGWKVKGFDLGTRTISSKLNWDTSLMRSWLETGCYNIQEASTELTIIIVLGTITKIDFVQLKAMHSEVTILKKGL